MPRQLRVEYEGAVYHVMSRGDRREDIFFDDTDREAWIQTLGEACGRTGWKVYAWVLMSNHYHLVVETPHGNLVAGMQWLQTTFTIRMNIRHRLSGHLFGGRYKAILIESQDSVSGQRKTDSVFGYLGAAIDYVHLNPPRAGLTQKAPHKGLMHYPWSSLTKGYLMPPGKRPPWLEVRRGLDLYGLSDTAKGRRAFLQRLETRIREEGKAAGKKMPEIQSLQSTLWRGWYFGSQAFRQKMLKIAGRKLNEKGQHYEAAELASDHKENQAEKIIVAYLKSRHLKEKDLPALKFSHPFKVELAFRLRKQTTVRLKWISHRLHMGSAANICHLLRRHHLSTFKS